MRPHTPFRRESPPHPAQVRPRLFNSITVPECSQIQLRRLIFKVSFIPSRQSTVIFSFPLKYPPMPQVISPLAMWILKRQDCLHRWGASLSEATPWNLARGVWAPGKGSLPHGPWFERRRHSDAQSYREAAFLWTGQHSEVGGNVALGRVLGDDSLCHDRRKQKLKHATVKSFPTNNSSTMTKYRGKN